MNWKLVIACTFCFVLVGCSRGTAPLLSQAAPETYFSVDPISRKIEFHNSKDVEFTVEEVVARKGDAEMIVKNLAVKDTSSSVRTANVEQINAAAGVTREIMAPVRDIAQRIPMPMANPQPEPAPAPIPVPIPIVVPEPPSE